MWVRHARRRAEPVRSGPWNVRAVPPRNPSGASSPGADSVMTMFEDASGDVVDWDLRGRLLDRFDRATGFVRSLPARARDPASLSGDRITSIVGAVDGRLWVGTGWRRTESVRPAHGQVATSMPRATNQRDSLPPMWCAPCSCDAAGGLWLGRVQALSFLPPRSESFRTYTSRQGLANDVIYGIPSGRTKPDGSG